MSETRRDDAPDAVVIGAGHNGLVAANLLCDAGWNVVICEATEYAGGALRSAEVTAPGYLSDLFSSFYPMSVASPVLNGLHLEDYGLRWTHAPSVLAHVFPDDRCAVLSRDLDLTAQSLDEFARGDGATWRRISADWHDIESLVLETLFSPLPALRPVRRLLSELGISGALRMARFATLPVRRYGAELFHGEGGPILLAGSALHVDISPEGAGSALYGWLLAMIGQSMGFPVPVGGASKLAESMVQRLAGAGGTLRIASPVESIDVQMGRAIGVRLRSGEQIRARRAVIADIPAPMLYRELVGEHQLPDRLLTDLANFQWDIPTFKVNWALERPIPWTAAGARGAATVHVGVDLGGMTRYAGDLATGTVPANPFLLVGQLTTSDATRSPAGTESAWAYTHLPHGVALTEDTFDNHLRLVESVLERHAPGFGNLIIGRYVQSPAKLQQENPALMLGAINGGTAQLHQQLVFRPIPGLGGASTPIDRLYLASSSAHPGGGVHGGPGSNAARAALAREGRLGSLRRSGTQLALRRIYA